MRRLFKVFRTHRLVLLSVLVVIFFQQMGMAAEARVYLDFNSPNLKKVPVAVPFFINKAKPGAAPDGVGKELAALLSRGLELHGFIEVVPPSFYNGSQENNWSALKVDFVILGSYAMAGEDIIMEVRLLDILEGRMIFGRKYKGPVGRQRDMVLTYCDAVIKQLTGVEGISRSRIAFTSDVSGFQEIYVADILGNVVRQVTRHRRLAVSPRFSPDGKLLTYTSYHSGNANLYITELAQSKLTKTLSKRQGLNLAPAWSPDGRTMALTLSMDGNPDLYLMDRSGKILRRLTSGAGINVSPSWSPDGKSLAFVSDRTGTPQVYTMDLKTYRTSRVTFGGNDNSEPAWSPDGEWLVFTSLTDGGYHIFIIRKDGSSPLRLTRSAGDHESPSWSPDGNQIVFSRRLDDKQMLYTIFKNGTGMRRLFAIDGKQKYPQWSVRDAN